MEELQNASVMALKFVHVYYVGYTMWNISLPISIYTYLYVYLFSKQWNLNFIVAIYCHNKYEDPFQTTNKFTKQATWW